MKTVFLAFLIFAITSGRGETGECRFDNDFCSCKIGTSIQGTCWDRVSGSPVSGVCRERRCRAGWTCACEGRTHLCPLVEKQRNVLDGVSADGTASCHQEVMKSAGSPIIELGNTTISLSRRGLLDNSCSQLSWWYNGALMGVYGESTRITEGNLEEEMRIRSTFTLLEFKSGDVLGFRFRHASYHCFNSYIRLSVNGTITDTGSDQFKVLFARAHSPNWFMPSFERVLQANESVASTRDFVPIRQTFLSSSLPIVPGTDYWQAPDGSEDHKVSNFYFRVEL